MVGDNLQSDDATKANTYLRKGSHITGQLRFEGTVLIEGYVEGEISAQESVLIGDGGVVNAQVTADSIVITGKVTGDVTARRRLEIRAPGQLHGNIVTPSLVIHDGVVFEGKCSMGVVDAKKGEKKGAATNDRANAGVPSKGQQPLAAQVAPAQPTPLSAAPRK